MAREPGERLAAQCLAFGRWQSLRIEAMAIMQPREALQVVPFGLHAPRQFVAPRTNARQLVVDIDVRIAFGGDEQGRPRQLERFVGALDQVDEIGLWVWEFVHGG